MGYEIEGIKGKRFGRFTVVEYMGRAKDRKHTWLCVCDCGNEKVCLENNLKNGHTSSCGCIGTEIKVKRNTTHGLCGDPLYAVWTHMRQRINDPNIKTYNRYGGRGISICEEWKSAEEFVKWGYDNGYKIGLTIDRKDNNGNYSPENCRFITMSEQNRNKSSNVRVEYNGESNVLWDWAEKLSMCYGTLRLRYGKGDRGKMLFRPSRQGKKKELA